MINGCLVCFWSEQIVTLNYLRQVGISFLKRILKPVVLDIITNEIRIWGDSTKLRIAPTAQMVNTMFNTSSGIIEIGDYTFTGHNVSIITGTHNFQSLLHQRVVGIQREGCDIRIGKGVWIGSNVVIIGPCNIGDHAVIAAGAVVVPGTEVKVGAVVAGIPARVIKFIDTIASKDL
jgi:acetyltransferase-like isoleucine patch superfamily enzyme